MKPISAQPLRARMSLQVPGERERQHLSFQCVVMPQGVAEQNYLVASFDFGRLPDKDIPITVEFSNLPDWRHPTASFTPLFSPSQIRPYVAEVQLTKADYDSVTRQRVCPVTGDVLGGKGQVVKLLIGDYPLYVCCQDCLDAVRQRPEKISSGKSRIQIRTTTIVPIPPISTAGTAPNQAAVKLDSNSPNWFEVPMNMEFTALTLPRISSGVLNCTKDALITTLKTSAARERPALPGKGRMKWRQRRLWWRFRKKLPP